MNLSDFIALLQEIEARIGDMKVAMKYDGGLEYLSDCDYPKVTIDAEIGEVVAVVASGG